MERIGFIGLGIMGKPMAHNLLKASYSLTVYNRSDGPVEELVAAGATAAASPQAVAANADVIITIVTDTPDVQQVLLGENGVIHTVAQDAVVIDMSTISPTATREIASTVQEKGASMLDAPVSGGEGGAIAGHALYHGWWGGGRLQSVLTHLRNPGKKHRACRSKRCGPAHQTLQPDRGSGDQSGDERSLDLWSEVRTGPEENAKRHSGRSRGVMATLEPRPPCSGAGLCPWFYGQASTKRPAARTARGRPTETVPARHQPRPPSLSCP